jgi:hypothetical protein
VTLAAIKRELPCQTKHARGEDDTFALDLEIQPAAREVLCAAIREYTQEFPVAVLFETFDFVVPKLTDQESAAVLGVVADLADFGGSIPPAWIQFALSKLATCNFTIPCDPIFLLRILIRDQPGAISDYLPALLPILVTKLTAEVSPSRYYWSTVTNVISTIFDLAFSNTFNGVIQIAEFMQPILSKLPVRGDYREAQFIYGTLFTIVTRMPEVAGPHVGEIFRVVTQTLANRNQWFAQARISEETQAGLVRVFQKIAARLPDCDARLVEILDGDPIRLATLRARVSG